jgi:hypothetical protein
MRRPTRAEFALIPVAPLLLASIALVGSSLAGAANLRDLTVHPSAQAAIADAIAQAKNANRGTFYPVAVFNEAGVGRGAVLATARRPHPSLGECIELAIASLTAERNPQYLDFGRVACPKQTGDGYAVHPDLPAPITEPRKNRVRSFLPPNNLAAGSVWRIENVEPLFLHSQAAAIGVAINFKQLPATMVWESVADRGAVHVYESTGSPGCRKVVTRVQPPPPGGVSFAAEYCPSQGNTAGWTRTVAKAPPPDEMAIVGPQLDDQLKQTRWSGITETQAPRAASAAAPKPADPPGQAAAARPADPPGNVAAARPAVTPPPPMVRAPAESAAPARPPADPSSRAPTPPAEPRRVLAPFAGYADATMFDDGSMNRAGVPWQPAAGDGEPLAAGRLAPHQAQLRHAMRALRVLYGSLSAAEDKTFEAFFAPFFDHPTQGASDYFGRLNPLLDESLASLASMDGTVSTLGESLQDAVMVGFTAHSAATRTAASGYGALKAERDNLDRLLARISALGNPPNPVAAKCAARARHRKALGGEADIWKLLRQTTFLAAAGNDEGAGDVELRYATWGTETSAQVDALIAAERPRTSLTWSGAKFSYVSKGRYFDAPCTKMPGGGHSSQDHAQISGEISADGLQAINLSGSNVQRFCKDDKTGQVTEERTSFSVARAPLYQNKPVQAGPGRIEIIYTNLRRPLPASFNDFDLKPGETFVRFATFLYTKEFELCGSLSCLMSDPRKKEECEARVRQECAAKKAARGSGQPIATAAPSGTAAASTPAPVTGTDALSAQDQAQAVKEAIAQHDALAAQIQRDADRWAADARREKDATRREELEKRALESAANAQAERDVSSSLRTGQLVKTRTAWDEKQQQALVDGIRKELAGFDEESRMVRNLPRVADMLGGADGVQLRQALQQQLSEAIRSPDRQHKIASLYGQVQAKVAEQGARQIATEEAKVAQWESRVAVAENVAAAAGAAVTLATLWSPTTMGTLALGYTGATGLAEGGPQGAATAIVRTVSNKADVLVSAYEGATRIDPATGQAAGAWGAMEGALWTIATNKAFEVVGRSLQKAKADYALQRQALGARGVAGVARPAGEARLKEFDFKTPEQRYRQELAGARTPAQQAEVRQRHAIQAERDAMQAEKSAALRRAEDAVRKGADQKTAREQLGRDLEAVRQKYKSRETRNSEHAELMKSLGFDPTPGPANKDLPATGGAAETAASDLDFAPSGATPHEAYQKGKRYTDALKSRGHNVIEYGDRWVDTTSDTTVWKPGYNADKPGSSSFEAEVIFGTLPGSDKFGTRGGVEWTSSATHSTADPLGAVLANVGKAVGAGLGNDKPKDLHTIGKSAVKAAEIAGIAVDGGLKAQIDGLKGHQTPEQAGVVSIGADAATRARQESEFLDKVNALVIRAVEGARVKSDQSLGALDVQARGTSEQALAVRAQVKSYRAGNEAAMATIAQTSPSLGKAFAAALPKSGQFKLRGPQDPTLAQALARERAAATAAPSSPLNASDPAIVALGPLCREAARRLDDRLKAARPGTDEARYLAQLQTALSTGAGNPAEAIRSVRSLAGTELSVVLRQLGVIERQQAQR